MTAPVRLSAFFAAMLLAAGARAAEPAVAPAPATPADSAGATVRIPDVPHVKQKPDFCGEACVEMWMRKLGYAVTQDDVFNRSGLNPAEGRGCYTRELVQACAALGFAFDRNAVYVSIDARKPEPGMEQAFVRLVADLKAGTPSIVCTRFDKSPAATEHFRLVTGYDPAAGEVIYNDPALEQGAGLRMKKADFFALWPLRCGAKTWVLVRLPLTPGRMAAPKAEEAARKPDAAKSFTAADYAQHIMKLRKKYDLKGLDVRVEPPFVVVGNMGAAVLESHWLATVRWTVARLKTAYFQKDPDRILTIWLLKDPATYEAAAVAVNGGKPDTPYGFFSSTADALIMNIATGGGTLVHEIVHPFVEANIPDCPPWFNEGLGSLYEQSGERDGRIVGFTNWRLAGLQTAIKGKTLPDFMTLCGYDRDKFYNSDKGNNYGQARYLLYYLQEKGLLGAFYKRFMETRKDDPSGYKALVETLGSPDMDVFQQAWEEFVLKLRFGR